MNNESKTDKIPFVERTRKSLVPCRPESSHDKNKSRSGKFTKFGIIPFLVLVIAFGVYKIIEGEKISKVQQAAEDETISKLVNRHNAITDWKSHLEQLDEVYVSDMQEGLINKDGRPLLLFVEAKDIVKEGGKSYIHFTELESDPVIHFTLECDSEQVRVVTEQRDDSSEYNVIASITSVRRANREDVRSDADISDAFIATGHCLELRLLSSENSAGIFIIIIPLAFIILSLILANKMTGNV